MSGKIACFENVMQTEDMFKYRPNEKQRNPKIILLIFIPETGDWIIKEVHILTQSC